MKEKALVYRKHSVTLWKDHAFKMMFLGSKTKNQWELSFLRT